jgi:PhoH-like ATPase
MQKIFVLDTNVLLHEPGALFAFADNEVVVPIVVIEEIDRFKKELTEVGRNARHFSRALDRLRQTGSLTDGVATEKGGRIRIHLGVDPPKDFPFHDHSSADMRILAIARVLTESDRPVTLITKDTNLRIKADVIGVAASDYREQNGAVDPELAAYEQVEVPREAVDRLYTDKELPVTELGRSDPGPNVCLLLRDVDNPQHSGLARRAPHREVVRPVHIPATVSGIKPRNVEQRFALDLLLDPEVTLVNLLGKAGTGKTLLALAAGLHQTVDRKAFRRMLVARPIFPMGRDLGYLPGDVEEKLRPWMQPVFDNLEFLIGGGGEPVEGAHPLDQLIDRGLLEVEALTYIRGRSLPRQFVIVDEAQNLTPHEVKTVITRAGEGTKLVLTGDPDQIDNPYVDAASNGLSYVSLRLAGEPMAGSINLTRGERSPLAEMAADRL